MDKVINCLLPVKPGDYIKKQENPSRDRQGAEKLDGCI